MALILREGSSLVSGAGRIPLRPPPFRGDGSVWDDAHSFSFSARAGKGEVLISQSVPKFARRFQARAPKRARLTENPYSAVIRDDTYGTFLFSGYLGVQPIRTFGNCEYSNLSEEPDFNWTGNDDLKLLSKLRNSVAGSDFNAGIMIGESREALSMISNAATRIYWGYRAAKHGDFRSAARYLTNGTDRRQLSKKTSSSNWLELQYGWLPLLNDVKGASEFLARMHSYPSQRTHRVSVRSVGLRPPNTGTPSVTRYNDFLVTRTKYLKAVISEIDEASLSGLTDPLSVAWELVPYSFVVDWFIPVGSYLSNRGLARSLTGKYVTTTVDRVKLGGFGKSPSATPETFVSPKEGTMSRGAVEMTRTVSYSLDVPMPAVKPLSKVASWQHAVNAVALLVNLK